MNNEIKKGDTVTFGRPNGEKTIGTVVRVSAKSYTIAQLEERGTQRTRSVGTKWRVAKSLVRPANPVDLGRLANGTASAPAPKRSDAEIIAELRDIEGRLSPENLFMDGERSRTAARREERKLNTVRARLIRELGREPALGELWGS